MPMLNRLEVLDHLLARLEPDDGPLPVLGPARPPADPALLAVLGLRPDGFDLDLEEGLDGLLDLGLVGRRGDLEAHLAVPLLEDRGLLGDDRTEDDLAGV